MIKLLNRLIALFINVLVLMLRMVIPKNKKLAVAGGWRGKRFADNSKYFFIDYCRNYRTSYDMYWVTRDNSIYESLKKRGYPVVKAKSLKSIWLHLRAQYHIIDQSYDDILGYLSLTSVRINIWHGLPMKRIWRASSTPSTLRLSSFLGDTLYDAIGRFLFPGGWSDFNLCIPSDYAAEHIFDCCISKRQLSHSIRCSYPRVDFLKNSAILSGEEQEGELVAKMHSIHSAGGRILIYMPTFRDYQNSCFLGNKDKCEIDSFLDRLNKNNIYLFIKPHPEDKVLASVVHPSIVMIPALEDVYPILKFSDALVTDYSSIFFDYSTLGKPIIFYVFDYEYYKSTDRGIMLDFDKFDIGPKADNFTDLAKEIFIEMGESNYSKKRSDFAKLVFQDNYPSLNEYLIRLISNKECN